MKPDQLSKTAAFVAIKFFGLTQIDSFRNLFEDNVITFYERLVKNLPAPLCYYHYWLQFGWVRSLYIRSEELFLPGDLLHIIARKWHIRKMATQLTKRGYEQIIVLGAGFDDLAFTLTQKGFLCFEFEAPFMAEQKRQFLNNCFPKKSHPAIIQSYQPHDHIGNQIKQHPEINPHKKTVIIAEGFFDYLKKDTVANILHRIGHYFEDNTCLITTHFALDELPLHHRWSFKSGVNAVGEKLKLNSSISEFENLLSQNNFSIKKEFSYNRMMTCLQNKTGTKLSVLKGFYLLMGNLK